MFNTTCCTNSPIVSRKKIPIIKSVADISYMNQHDHTAPTQEEIMQNPESRFKALLV